MDGGSVTIDSLNLVDRRWVPAAGGRVSTSFNPADGSAVGRFADSSIADADAAIAAARRAFEESAWSASPRVRQQVLLDWADAVGADIDGLARLLTLENGKPVSQARREVGGAISEIRYYAGLCRHNPGHVQEVEPGALSIVTREAAGVVGIIVPWNAPCVLLVRALAPALAAGCTAVVKPAPQTALFTARMLKALSEREGIPSGVVNMVSEQGTEVAKRLVSSPDVDVLSFTGSSSVGKQIMASAAGTLKRLSLELGGKACCVVFDDCDVPKVASQLAAAATIIAGQQCTGARRVLVDRRIMAGMKTALTNALAAVKVGSGFTDGVQMGPLIDAKARSRVEDSINAAYDVCDEVLLRGHELGGDLTGGSFLTPSLIEHHDSDAFFSQEEIFGPLVVMEPFDSEQEAIAKANNTVYGLSASVWTNQLQRAFRVARALRKGTVWFNNHNKLFAEAETGGYKQSGLGRMHGFHALDDFVQLKHVYLESKADAGA